MDCDSSPAATTPSPTEQAYQAGFAAGAAFHDEFDRTGGRQRTLPLSPYENDPQLNMSWQTGFDDACETAWMRAMFADGSEPVELFEEDLARRHLDAPDWS